MSIWDKINEANPTKGGNVISDGSYLLALEQMVEQAGQSGPMIVLEARVMEAAPVSVAPSQRNEGEDQPEPTSVGSSVSFVFQLNKHQNAAGNARAAQDAFLSGLGYSAGQITPQVREQVCGAVQPLRGAVARCTTYRKQNQGRNNPANKGIWMTLPGWQPVLGQTADSVKQVRTQLDASGPIPTPSPTPVATPAPTPATTSAPTPTPAAPPAGGSDFLSSLGLSK